MPQRDCCSHLLCCTPEDRQNRHKRCREDTGCRQSDCIRRQGGQQNNQQSSTTAAKPERTMIAFFPPTEAVASKMQKRQSCSRNVLSQLQLPCQTAHRDRTAVCAVETTRHHCGTQNGTPVCIRMEHWNWEPPNGDPQGKLPCLSGWRVTGPLTRFFGQIL